jgi:TRAP-type C4-dicarboxylate transport system substrate-binding protein
MFCLGGPMLRWTAVALLLGLTVLSGCKDRGVAGGKPTAKIHVIGSTTNSNIYKALEEPFWTQQLPQASEGRITTDLRSIQESGLKSPQIARLLGAGALDVAYGDFASIAGDIREFEGLDLAGVFTDLETMHKAADAYKPVIDRIFNQHGIKLLGLFPYPEFALYCAGEVASLADLKGKKVRVTVESMSEFIHQVGGVPVVMPFPDVVPALQTGVADCAITGTYTGNRAGWGEVTDSLFTLPIGTGVSFYGYSTRNWLELDPSLRELIESEFIRFERDAWELTKTQTLIGIHCNTGHEGCTGGKPGHMSLHPPSDADIARAHQIALDVVIPSWATRCGRQCVEDWNSTVGPVAGIQIPLGE